MQTLAILLIGFSVFSALTVAVTHFTVANYQDKPLSRMAGILLLLTLAGLQLAHYVHLQYGSDFVHTAYYAILLFTAAPAFYLFSAPLLEAQLTPRPKQLLHLLPILGAPLIPSQWALPLSFLIGLGYLLWLAKSVYALRAQRERFRVELLALLAFFVIALGVLVLGLALPLVTEKPFFSLYAIAIGLAFLITGIGLHYSPHITTEITEAARETYAISTLNGVDCSAALSNLQTLMERDTLYRQPNLDLPTLAWRVGLSGLQLSELVSTRMGKSVSRYLREYRVDAAEALLLDEPSTPVLTVGRNVGFASQANFYDAFREINGMTPGKFRTLNA